MKRRGSGANSKAGTRTFEALPPTKNSRAPFAESWWGRAWVAALEESSLDAGRLQRGRTYARGGAVGDITVGPGSAAAQVRGSRPAPYRSTMRVRQFTDQEWDRLLDVIAERAANIAALLDGEMPPGLADDAEAAGVVLLPGPQDLEPRCNCPDWGYPCKHAAALCYQVARLLDRDPFVLLLLRGRDEPWLTAELGRRNMARAATEATSGTSDVRAPAAEPAEAAFRAELPPLPELPEPPVRPGRGPRLTEASAPAPGVDPQGLELLAADTALRAYRLAVAAADVDRHADTELPALLTEWQDAVRIAAAEPEACARIAAGCGRPRAEVAVAAEAWSHGGAPSLDVLERAWTPPPRAMERAREALRAERVGPALPLRTWRNRLTVEGQDAQLRLGEDGLWYPYVKERGSWWPRGAPDPDPVVALAVALGE